MNTRPETLALLASARRALADLYRPDPRRYWAELVVSALVGWTALLLGIAGVGGLPGQLVLGLVAMFAMHRSTAFLHELVHFRGRLPGVAAAWNAVWGLPLLLPSWLYERAHLDHHRRHLFGTAKDPEYLPLAHLERWKRVVSAVGGLAVPLVLAVRFMVLSPLGWLSRRARSFIDRKLSALALNPEWEAAEPDAELSRRMRRDEVVIFAWAWSVVAAVVGGLLPVAAVVLPLAVMVGAMACNQLRAHAAHKFENDGRVLDDAQMLADSINVEGRGPVAWLLFPLGVQYHALHHLAPALPFHHLAAAHRRLLEVLPQGSLYHQAERRGLRGGIGRLFTAPQRPGAVAATAVEA